MFFVCQSIRFPSLCGWENQAILAARSPTAIKRIRPFRLRRKQIPETSRSGTSTTRHTRSRFLSTQRVSPWELLLLVRQMRSSQPLPRARINDKRSISGRASLLLRVVRRSSTSTCSWLPSTLSMRCCVSCPGFARVEIHFLIDPRNRTDLLPPIADWAKPHPERVTSENMTSVGGSCVLPAQDVLPLYFRAAEHGRYEFSHPSRGSSSLLRAAARDQRGLRLNFWPLDTIWLLPLRQCGGHFLRAAAKRRASSMLPFRAIGEISRAARACARMVHPVLARSVGSRRPTASTTSSLLDHCFAFHR